MQGVYACTRVCGTAWGPGMLALTVAPHGPEGRRQTPLRALLLEGGAPPITLAWAGCPIYVDIVARGRETPSEASTVVRECRH
jgi:hypothetical protein